MKTAVVFCLVLGSVLSAPSHGGKAPAPPCDPTKCILPNCRCSSQDIPGGLNKTDTPQFVMLTFDDNINLLNMGYYRSALYNRLNPNKCPLSATFFDSHEYTDYSFLHELHSKGMEISLHSITHEPLTTYWMNATIDLLRREFVDQRKLVSKFASIPLDSMKGIRMPFLQLAGNNQFEMMMTDGFLYDLSWPTQEFMSPGLWPYTTDYLSSQDCLIGPCPNISYPGIWVVPMIGWEDLNGHICSMVDACTSIPKDVTGLSNWMIREFYKQYYGNRAPFGFFLHAGWFTLSDVHFKAYINFLDHLRTLPDVYVTNPSTVIQWIKNPKKVSEMQSSDFGCQKTYTPHCDVRSCKFNEEEREYWMTCCVECPKSYPWLGNPLGN